MPDINAQLELIEAQPANEEDKYWEAQAHIDTLYMELDACEFNLVRAMKRVAAVDGEIRKRLQESQQEGVAEKATD